MAWLSHGRTNDGLVSALQKNKLITSDRVATAMRKVDRKNYVRVHQDAYFDAPSSIDFGATISAPHMHAHAAEYLLPLFRPGARILDVGSGSGYTAAVFYFMADNATVVGIDHIPQLVEFSVQNLRNDGLGAQLDQGNIMMIAGDGRKGYPSQGSCFYIVFRRWSSERV